MGMVTTGNLAAQGFPAAIVFIFVGFAALIILIAVQGNKRRQARRVALAKLAESWGGTYTNGENSRVEKRFPHYDWLQRGDSRYGYNIIRAERAECDVHAFDYHYSTTSTDSKGRRHTTHHHFSAVVLEVPYALRPLHIRKEGFFDRIGDMFGGGDIDFESAEFSKRFHVKALNRKWAYDVIPTKTMELLLDGAKLPVAMAANTIATWSSRHFDPPDFRANVDLLVEFIGNIPADIRDSIRIEAPPDALSRGSL